MSAYKKLPEILTLGERTALLKQPNKRAPTGLRNLCMIRVMLDCGLRCCEIIKLQPRHIDWMSGKLTVKEGKGKKDRIVWLNEDVLELLQIHRVRRPEAVQLFSTLDSKPLNSRYIRTMVKRLAVKAGIDKDIHPHTLRHTFATDLYRQTKNIRLVQKALGHSNLSTTMIYTHIVDDELESALKGFRTNGSTYSSYLPA